jgi:formamidopyrimidine-DNA glycosylase
MPELPEVETLRSQLDSVVSGKTIKTSKVKWPKMVSPLSPTTFNRRLKNRKIIGVDRRAKMLVFRLNNTGNKKDPQFLAVHLKMTGQLVFCPKSGQATYGGHPQKDGTKDLPNKHTHIIIDFIDGSNLYFNDMRKFGWMRLLTQSDLDDIFSRYGLEALSAKFSISAFRAMMSRYPNRKIKQLLLDQTLIAGIGNIYADEACFATGVMPTRNLKDISDVEAKSLLSHVKRILKLSIAKKGTSYSTYVNLDGNSGGFVPYLKVYGRKGDPCKKCKNPIDRMRVVGRGTHYCSICQK